MRRGNTRGDRHETRGLSQRTLAAAAEHLSADNYDDRFAYSTELILTGRSGST
ncbi:hypothetical protein ACFRH4_47810 [Streptomyces mirabilis]|uniref:hypothetical protein n=1 Tax=Streptomyces mirabilis TaxID=68239 RepID=UPI0036A7BEF0